MTCVASRPSASRMMRWRRELEIQRAETKTTEFSRCAPDEPELGSHQTRDTITTDGCTLLLLPPSTPLVPGRFSPDRTGLAPLCADFPAKLNAPRARADHPFLRSSGPRPHLLSSMFRRSRAQRISQAIETCQRHAKTGNGSLATPDLAHSRQLTFASFVQTVVGHDLPDGVGRVGKNEHEIVALGTVQGRPGGFEFVADQPDIASRCPVV